jgi:hypothetical protein
MTPEGAALTERDFSHQLSAPAAQGTPDARPEDGMSVADDLLAVAAFALVVVLEFIAIFVAGCVEIVYQSHLEAPTVQSTRDSRMRQV